MKGIIFTNGSYLEVRFYLSYLQKYPEAMIICADGGTNFAKKAGIKPDLIIGDMDSVSQKILTQYTKEGVTILKASTHKNETDTELAVEYCIKKGFEEVVLFGALGDRLDHSFGNLYLLNRLLKAGIKGKIINEKNCIFLVEHQVELEVKKGDTVSILSFVDRSEGINLRGFEYPVTEGVMEHYLPGYGISNVALEEHPIISVKKGILLVDIVHE
ncbi:MAG: thiamine diphosphokinase [Eubacterium sp.]